MAEVVTNSSARGTRRYTPATATVAPYHAKKKKKKPPEIENFLPGYLLCFFGLWALSFFF
jgi:hypothetical protein